MGKVSFTSKKISVMACVVLLTAACGTNKMGQVPNTTNAPKLDGFQSHALSLPAQKNGADNHQVKIEIVPGKTMEVDCNNHSLMGAFSEKTLSDKQQYFVFESNGNVASTLMACPDNTKQKKFVSGESIFFDSKENIPSQVFTSEGIEIKQRVWTSSTPYFIEKGMIHTTESEAATELKAYPEAMEGYDRYVLMLPEISNAFKDRKVELIPGITSEVDCNQHSLMGTFVEKTIDGWGYNYFVFESKGGIRSTRMACPDKNLTKEFVTGATHLMNYNSLLPIVVFIPKQENFALQYMIWEASELK